jgi:hypothetical protein
MEKEGASIEQKIERSLIVLCFLDSAFIGYVLMRALSSLFGGL